MMIIQNDNASYWQSKRGLNAPPPQLNWKFWLVLHPNQTCLLLAEAQAFTPGVWKVPVKRQLTLFLHRRLFFVYLIN